MPWWEWVLLVLAGAVVAGLFALMALIAGLWSK
jgi:hypothetical protein